MAIIFFHLKINIYSKIEWKSIIVSIETFFTVKICRTPLETTIQITIPV